MSWLLMSGYIAYNGASIHEYVNDSKFKL